MSESLQAPEGLYMTIGDISTKITMLTNVDTNGYTNAQRLIDINQWYQKAATMILEAQDESDFDDARNSDYPIMTTSLVAGQRDYSIPVSEKVLKIKNVQVTYDGTNWFKAEPLDINELAEATSNVTTTDGMFSTTAPRYDVQYNSIFIYPTASQAQVTAGAAMKVQWTRQVTEFTSSDLTTGTAVPGFDDPFHPILAYGPAFEFALAKNLPQTKNLFDVLTDYENRLKKHYSTKQQDRRYNLVPDFVDYK